MQEFQILDERRFCLQLSKQINKDSSVWRFEHRATIGYRGRTFLVLVDNLTTSIYIEEITTGHLEKIEDDSLHTALSVFAEEKGFCRILPPLLKDINHRNF